MCVWHVCIHMCATTSMWRSEDDLQELALTSVLAEAGSLTAVRHKPGWLAYASLGNSTVPPPPHRSAGISVQLFFLFYGIWRLNLSCQA